MLSNKETTLFRTSISTLARLRYPLKNALSLLLFSTVQRVSLVLKTNTITSNCQSAIFLSTILTLRPSMTQVELLNSEEQLSKHLLTKLPETTCPPSCVPNRLLCLVVVNVSLALLLLGTTSRAVTVTPLQSQQTSTTSKRTKTTSKTRASQLPT